MGVTRGAGFSNWSRTVTAAPTLWVAPADEASVVALVRETRDGGGRLKVVGAGHSFSEIAAPVEVAVTLDRCSGIVSESAGTVTVRAGTRLHALNAALAERGLALPILGSIAQQSVAGAIATGTHGPSLRHGNLATLVERVRLVDGTGTVHDLEGDRLDAVRVHLGALGVLTEVTLRVEPAFRLEQTIEAAPVGEVAAQLDAIGHSAEYVKVWWVPHTDDALVIRYERTDRPTTRSTRVERWIDQRVIHPAVLPTLFALQRRRPTLVARLNPVVARTLVKGPRVGPSTLMFSTPDPARHDETEAAVPLAAGPAAFDALVRVAGEVAVNFIAELRFVQGDRGWLSPAHGRDTVQLGAYTAHSPDRDRYFGDFWREARALGARPHWGKALTHTADELAPLYPRWTDFGALRDELDPQRVFANPFLERVLGA